MRSGAGRAGRRVVRRKDQKVFFHAYPSPGAETQTLAFDYEKESDTRTELDLKAEEIIADAGTNFDLETEEIIVHTRTD